MSFGKACLSNCAALGIAAGIFAGGLTMAYGDYLYDKAVADPGFFHLVDELGNPVRQKLD